MALPVLNGLHHDYEGRRDAARAVWMEKVASTDTTHEAAEAFVLP